MLLYVLVINKELERERDRSIERGHSMSIDFWGFALGTIFLG